jgi:hypothetical protein
MDLKEYFENSNGLGVLATADSSGKVNAAVYARPHIMEDGNIAMILRDRLTRHNLNSNPHAAYLFKEEGKGYMGKRFHLTKIREEEESELLHRLRRRSYIEEKDDGQDPKYLVIFQIDKYLPLIGPGE